MVAVLEQKSDRGVQKKSSDRNFGFVFAAFFTIVTVMPLFRHGEPRWWALAAALLFGALALTRPQTLHWPNRLWLALGELLHKIISPIVMSVIFFGCVTPIAWLMRSRGKDPLSLNWDKQTKSYWIERQPVSGDGQSMTHQF